MREKRFCIYKFKCFICTQKNKSNIHVILELKLTCLSIDFGWMLVASLFSGLEALFKPTLLWWLPSSLHHGFNRQKGNMLTELLLAGQRQVRCITYICKSISFLQQTLHILNLIAPTGKNSYLNIKPFYLKTLLVQTPRNTG